MSQGTNIINVHANATKKELVEARIDRKVFSYFFHHCLTGTRGPRQALVAFFFQRFYEACVLDGIAPVWDEDNERRINDVLQRLNFVDTTKKSRGSKPKPAKTIPKSDLLT
jgi:hypothetical protein